MARTVARCGIARCGITRCDDIDVPKPQLLLAGADASDFMVDLALTRAANSPSTCTVTITRIKGDGTVIGTAPAVGNTVEIRFGDDQPSHVLFKGNITQLTQQMFERPDAIRWTASCADWRYLLNRRLITARWASTSGTTIAKAIISGYTSGFTSNHVQAGLDTIDEIIFTNEAPDQALSRLADALGADFYFDSGGDLHFFVGAEAGVSVAVTVEGNEYLLGYELESDLSQIVTRVIVEGATVNVLRGVNANTFAAVPVEDFDTTPWDAMPQNTPVRIGAQILSFKAAGAQAANTVTLTTASAVGDNHLHVSANLWSSGGWARIGSDVVSYTAEAAGVELQGIPTSGASSLMQAYPVGTVVSRAAVILLTAAPASNVSAGDTVAMRVVRNDTTAQTALAAIEGGDGVHEVLIQDGRLGYDGCVARGDAELTLYKEAEQRFTYVTRDRRAQPGRQVTVSLGTPTSVSGTRMIQQVEYQFDRTGQRWPIKTVKTSIRLHDLYDILRRLERV